MKRLNYSFYFLWSIAFLVIVIIGFVPSFIFRPFFRETSIPLYLTIHGVFMIAWFAGYFHQNYLIARGSILNHRAYGMYWFILAAVMMIANINVLISISAEVLEAQTTYYGEIRTYENTGGLAIGNLYLSFCSALFIGLAYFKRKNIKIHKRALFGACVFLLAPAFDRFMRPFHLDEINPALNFLILLYMIPISLLIYDFKKYRKPHLVSISILAALLLIIPIITILINNELHIALINYLG
ncbi:MAG: hypothetical protein P8X57_09340 [Cyclobacteriaceae bacterium]